MGRAPPPEDPAAPSHALAGTDILVAHDVLDPVPASAPSAAPAPANVLARRLGPFDAAAIIVSNVIGGGILFTPPQVAAMVPNPWWFLGLWAFGGALAFAGAMAYAELAALRPRAGGEYVYLRAAYGRLAAFLTGWTSFVAGFAGAIAASAVVFVLYLDRFIPGVANSTPFFVVPIPFVPLSFSRQTIVAIVAVWLFRRHPHPRRRPGPLRQQRARDAQDHGPADLHRASVSRSAQARARISSRRPAPVAAGGWLLALIPVMFTYSGWNAAAYMAEEIRNPGRNVPLALGVGTAAVIAIYLLLNTLYLYVMPVGELAAVRGSVLDVVAEKLLGVRAGHIMGVVSIISLAASINAYDVCRTARVLRDGPRRRVLPVRGARPSKVQDAGRVDRRAGPVGDRPGPHRQPRQADDVCRVRDHAVWGNSCRRRVRLARARAGGAPAVQGVGISRRPRRSSRSHRCSSSAMRCGTISCGRS